MRLTLFSSLRIILPAILLARLIMSPVAYLSTEGGFIFHPHLRARAAPQNSNLRIKERNPVVNENNQIKLTAIDTNGQPVTDVAFESGSPDIASVDPKTGVVTGVQRGFATITARRGNDSASVFVAVARVSNNNGAKVPGDTKTDTVGRIYISDPKNSVILRKDGLLDVPNIFAGQKGVNGRKDGNGKDAQFNTPTAVAVDNGALGGIYVADTANHSIRKIGFNDQVTTVLGTGAPGMNTSDETSFGLAMFRGLRGVAADIGGNLFIADTENHAIYYADFAKQQLFLLAGEPGVSGKADGRGRAARFTRPTSIALSPDGRAIAVADTGNNRVRLITRDGDVTTLGAASSAKSVAVPELWAIDQAADEIVFDTPQSVSFDSRGNIYVVDNSGVEVVTFPANKPPQVVSLAQTGTFGQAASVVIQGTDAVVLDAGATEAEAVKDVTVGGPEIASLSKDFDRLEGGTEVIITGKNFAPESRVVLGDSIVDARVESATQISFFVPAQNAPGNRTLSVLTRGGVTQRVFKIVAKSFQDLAIGQITTIVGGVPFSGDSGSATNAQFSLPQGVAVDAAGIIFIADGANLRIRRVDTSRVVNTVAGNGAGGFSGDGGLALSNSLGFPAGLALDAGGNLFIADRDNNRIRRVDAKTGIITTVAGNGTVGFSGDGGPAASASLNLPFSVAIDAKGNLFFADTGNSRIRRVDASTKTITTVAGNGIPGFGGDGGPAVNASLAAPISVALDAAGNLFIADFFNHRVQRVDAGTGTITTVAGNGVQGFNGDGRQATSASLAAPSGVTVDGAGNLFISDTRNNRIRQVDASTGIITTVVGNGTKGFGGDGGLATSANLAAPRGVAVDGEGNLFIADQVNNRIRRVDANTKIITTVAGTDISNGDGGPAIDANLPNPFRLVLDQAGNLFIANPNESRIRRVDAGTGIITTVAGNGSQGFGGDGGPATSASLNLPFSMAIDAAGNLFIADRNNNRIRRVDPAGIISTIAGNGIAGFAGDGGPAIRAKLFDPEDIAIDGAGNLFISDHDNNRIRRIESGTSIITTVAGNGTAGFGGDEGPATSASLRLPTSVAVDQAGNLFISDQSNNRIRRVDANTKIITTVAGNGTAGFSGDGGPATSASLNNPEGIGLDRAGNLFIADSKNNRIRRVDANTKNITTVAGDGNPGYSGDGGPAIVASLNSPKGVAIDGAGNLLIASGFNNAIRIVKGPVGSGPAPDFLLSVNPTSQTVPAGASIDFTVNVQGFGGFTDPIDLGAVVSPPGSNVTVSLLPNSVRPGSKAIMRVSTTADTAPSTFSIAITGSAGQIVHTQSVALVVTGSTVGGDFTLAFNPTSQTVSAGASTSFMVSVQAMGGFSQPVTLSASSSESSITTSFSPSTVTPDGSATLTINTTAGTPANTYTITVTGTASPLVRTKALTLIVTLGDFALTVSPSTQAVTPNGSTNFTASVQAIGSFTQAVSLSATVSPPSSITTSFSPSSITPGNNSTLTVNAGADAQPGTFTITVTGAAGQLVRTKIVMLNVVVPDFALILDPAQLTVQRGQKGQITVNISRTGGFSGNVTVTAPDTKALKIKLTPPMQSTTGASVSFNFKIKKSAPTGAQQLLFTGRDDSGRVRTATLTLAIQ